MIDSPTTRRCFTTLAGLLLLTLCGCAVSSTAEEPGLRSDSGPGTARPSSAELRVGALSTQNTLTLALGSGLLAQHLGAHGDRVSGTDPFTAFAPAGEALAAGRIDATSAGAVSVLTSIEANPEVVVFAVERNDGDTQGIVATAASGIRSVSQLTGRTVAVNQGGTGEYLLRLALDQAGLDLGDVEPVYLAPADAATAFASGQVDAWATWDQFLVGATAQPGARVVVTAAELGGGNPVVHVVGRRFLEAHPETVAAAYGALIDQAETVRADPELLVNAYVEAGTAADVAAAIGRISPPTIEPADTAFAERMEELAAFAQRTGLTSSLVDVGGATVDVSGGA